MRSPNRYIFASVAARCMTDIEESHRPELIFPTENHIGDSGAAALTEANSLELNPKYLSLSGGPHV